MNQHLSSEQITNFLIGEENASEQQHLSQCAICRGELDDLRNAFSAYRDAGRNWSEHCRTQPLSTRQRARPRKSGWWAVSGGFAVAALAAVLLIRQPALPVPVEEPFVSIPYVVPAASYERTQVTRMNVPVAALRSVGMSIQLLDPGASVRADVLLGQDGRALAVRLLDRRNN